MKLPWSVFPREQDSTAPRRQITELSLTSAEAAMEMPETPGVASEGQLRCLFHPRLAELQTWGDSTPTMCGSSTKEPRAQVEICCLRRLQGPVRPCPTCPECPPPWAEGQSSRVCDSESTTGRRPGWGSASRSSFLLGTYDAQGGLGSAINASPSYLNARHSSSKQGNIHKL